MEARGVAQVDGTATNSGGEIRLCAYIRCRKPLANGRLLCDDCLLRVKKSEIILNGLGERNSDRQEKSIPKKRGRSLKYLDQAK